MGINKEKIRHILQFFFDKSENPRRATENVNTVYGTDAQFWFHRFRSGNFNLKDAPRPNLRYGLNNRTHRVRPSTKHYFDCTRAKCCTKTTWKHFYKFDICVPHELMK